jgi:hypothetical protein
MRRYSRDDEERIRAQALVREWTRSGLLDSSQSARLEGELRVDVKRTNVFLRVGLVLFTGLIVGASVLLVVTGLELHREVPLAVATGLAAAVCIGLAEVLAGQFRFYRFGVEEALAVASVLLLSFSGSELTATRHGIRFGEASIVVGLAIAAAGGLGVYLRFGFVYAAIGSMACAALIPFELGVSSTTSHILAAAILALVLAVVRLKRLQYQDDYPGDEYGQVQAAAWAGLYLMLNVQLPWHDHVERWFYWCTYATTWVLPIVGLGWAIRERDRTLIDVSIVMALVTLLTNKLYLGWPRYEWDPILLGVFLMAAALALRQWLSNGPGGERGGFTPARLTTKDSAVLTVLRAASATFQPEAPHSRADPVKPDPAKPDAGGGRSGGGGGGATY